MIIKSNLIIIKQKDFLIEVKKAPPQVREYLISYTANYSVT